MDVCLQSKNDGKHAKHDVKERRRAGGGRGVCAASGNQTSPDSPIHANLNAFGAETTEGAEQTKSLIFHCLACRKHTRRSFCWSLFAVDILSVVSRMSESGQRGAAACARAAILRV